LVVISPPESVPHTPGASMTEAARGGPPACASHPDFDRRSRSCTWSTVHWLWPGRGLSPPVRSFTAPRARELYGDNLATSLRLADRGLGAGPELPHHRVGVIGGVDRGSGDKHVSPGL